ncbi:MAG: DNA replication protein DnaC [Planctomycetes bacterium]|nr:DNA replication protein DnaC [Planctomycetota bacterium]MBI3835713.1 DNA replication protein DnaC [Planctomycetota bacterium]
MKKSETVLTLASPTAQRLYHCLCTTLQPLGPFREELKKTSVHLVRNSAFAGVHFRREYLIITMKSSSAIDSPRISKCEQTSRSRWHCDVKIAKNADVNRQLIAWLKAAYELCT